MKICIFTKNKKNVSNSASGGTLTGHLFCRRVINFTLKIASDDTSSFGTPPRLRAVTAYMERGIMMLPVRQAAPLLSIVLGSATAEYCPRRHRGRVLSLTAPLPSIVLDSAHCRVLSLAAPLLSIVLDSAASSRPGIFLDSARSPRPGNHLPSVGTPAVLKRIERIDWLVLLKVNCDKFPPRPFDQLGCLIRLRLNQKPNREDSHARVLKSTVTSFRPDHSTSLAVRSAFV